MQLNKLIQKERMHKYKLSPMGSNFKETFPILNNLRFLVNLSSLNFFFERKSSLIIINLIL